MTVYKQNNKWYYQFMINGERRHGAIPGASEKKEAEKIESAIKLRVTQQQNGLIPREEKNVTFGKLKAIYESYSKNNKKSYENEKYTLKIIADYFGNGTIVQKITPKYIEKFKEFLKTERKVKNSTINRYLEILSKMFNLGIDNEMIRNNPLEKTAKLREDNHKIRFLTNEEEKRLFAEIERKFKVLDKNAMKKKTIQPYLYLKPIIITALQTGMRKGEILGLKWDNIDFHLGFIELLDTKSGKARKIPISKTLKTILNKNKSENEYVFVNPKTKTRYYDIKKSFNKILKSANIKNFRFHDLRHTVATRLVENNIDLSVIQEILGHAHVETTMRYAHPVPKRKLEAINILETYLKK